MLAAMKFAFASSSGSLFALAFVTACGEKPQPVAPVAAPPPPAVVDMSPVAAPATLVAWGRASNPEKTVGTAFGFVGLPAPGGDALGELLDMKDVASVADMTAPLETAVFLAEGRSPRPRVLVSIPLRSVADAKQKLAQYKIHEEGGVTTLSFDKGSPSEQETTVGSGADKLCLIAPAVTATKGAPSSHRLVCGRKDLLDQYASYMTRTLPTLPSPSPLYGEFYMKPLRGPSRELARMAGSLRLLFDTPELAGLVDLAIAAAGDAVDFTQDLDTAFVKADITDAGARATLGMRFGAAKSTMTSYLVQHPERATAAPPGIDSVPNDPALVAFHHGIDLGPFEKALGQLHAVLVDLAKSEKFPEAERTELDALLTRTKAYTAHSAVSSRGFDDAAVDKAMAAYAPGKDTGAAGQKLRFAAADALDGWHAYRSDGSPDELVKLCADWGKLLASPALKRWIAAELVKADTKGTPGPMANLGTGKEAKRILDLFTVKVKTSKAPAAFGLPAGTDLVEVTAPRFAAFTRSVQDVAPPGGKQKAAKAPPPAPKPTPVVFKMFVTADGGGNLSVYSTDPKLAADKLKEAIAKSGARSDAMKKVAAMKASGGGFVTLRAGAAVYLESMLGAGSASERNVRRFKNASKDQGIFFSWRAQAPAAGAAGGSFEIDLDVPAKTVVAGIGLIR